MLASKEARGTALTSRGFPPGPAEPCWKLFPGLHGRPGPIGRGTQPLQLLLGLLVTTNTSTSCSQPCQGCLSRGSGLKTLLAVCYILSSLATGPPKLVLRVAPVGRLHRQAGRGSSPALLAPLLGQKRGAALAAPGPCSCSMAAVGRSLWGCHPQRTLKRRGGILLGMLAMPEAWLGLSAPLSSWAGNVWHGALTFWGMEWRGPQCPVWE